MERGQKYRGFTIVELLIVIVVIGILAGLVVVAYNGIRTRSEISATKVDSSNFVKALELQKAETGTFPAAISANATELPGYKLSAGNQVAKYTTSNNNTAFRACVISVKGDTVTAYSIYDTTTGGLVESGSGSGPLSDCTPPLPEYVGGVRCPVITFGTPYSLNATENRVSVTYNDSTISRITRIDTNPVTNVYIDQGALRRHDFLKSEGLNWNNVTMNVRGTNSYNRTDCRVTFTWPAG